MTKIANELRRAPANMIGTEFEDFYWKIHDLAKEIDEDEGRCRFNCRTAKSAFIAGYELAHGFELTEREKQVIGGKYFQQWKGNKDAESG